MVLLLLKQQCDEPAISTLSQLELQPHIVREVQRRLRLRGSRLTVTDGSQLGLSILRPDENLGSMYRCQVRSRQRWIHHTLLAGLCWVQTAWTPLIVLTDGGLSQSETRNQDKVTPAVNSSHNNMLKITQMLLIPRGSFVCLFNHACATGLICSHSIYHTNRLGYLCKTH